MTIDEMIIQVRVTAEGVKQGVADALEELKKLEAEKERLIKLSDDSGTKETAIQKETEIIKKELGIQETDYKASLDNKNAARKLAAENETEFLKPEFEKQEKNHKAMVNKITSQEEAGQADKLGKIQAGTTNILDYLQLKIAEFEAKGKVAGEAYAQAFREAAESIMSDGGSSPDGSVSTSSTATAAAGNAVVQNITFTMPVATPSKVAAETAYALELMTRNI